MIITCGNISDIYSIGFVVYLLIAPVLFTDLTTSPSSSGVMSGITTVSVAVTGLDSRPLSAKKVRPKPASPNRQGPQQCQVSTKFKKKTIKKQYRTSFFVKGTKQT